MSLWKSLCGLLISVVVVVNAVQYPFNSFKTSAPAPAPFDPFDAALFTPIEQLSLLSTNQFTYLAHPAFPKYNVRIKKSDWCDGTVKYACQNIFSIILGSRADATHSAFTGYIDIEARHLFFYFFESRSNPDKDDVIFWTNGGPGCSSSLGLLMELGACG